MTYQLHHGNMLDILPMMERDSIDAIVTDPPYGLGFMGKDWDHGVPGEHFWREVYRVAKPGAHLLAFGGTRTFHRLACAIEDAGWEIRDCVMWVYGQGFPKSHDVSKAIDREAGAEREVIGRYQPPNGSTWNLSHDKAGGNLGALSGLRSEHMDITSPATPAASEWDGWGTALKPSWEPVIIARKPLQGTVAENVQRYGTGALNIDGCRIEMQSEDREAYEEKQRSFKNREGSLYSGFNTLPMQHAEEVIANSAKGRWPANLIHDGSAEVLAGFPMTNSKWGKQQGSGDSWFGAGNFGGRTDDIERWIGDTGSAARFFYCAKASKQDRDEGCEDLSEVLSMRYGEKEQGPLPQQTPSRPTPQRNHHPTVKPTALMRYLCRLVTPPAGVILDPFMGSGSTGKAAMLEGFNFIGVDTEIEYVEIAARRIEAACEKVGIVVEQPMMFETKRETVDRPKQLILL